jgi:hypothetical protein
LKAERFTSSIQYAVNRESAARRSPYGRVIPRNQRVYIESEQEQVGILNNLLVEKGLLEANQNEPPI